jgi:hypothetical protein
MKSVLFFSDMVVPSRYAGFQLVVTTVSVEPASTPDIPTPTEPVFTLVVVVPSAMVVPKTPPPIAQPDNAAATKATPRQVSTFRTKHMNITSLVFFFGMPAGINNSSFSRMPSVRAD